MTMTQREKKCFFFLFSVIGTIIIIVKNERKTLNNFSFNVFFNKKEKRKNSSIVYFNRSHKHSIEPDEMCVCVRGKEKVKI